MNTKTFYRLLALLVILLLSCNFATGLVGGGGNGPKNFSAELSAPDVVALKWDAVEGATGYILELSIDNGESVQFVVLPPDRTSYEDLSAPEKSKLTYQVQAVTKSGPAGKSQVSIVTDVRKPNPLTVKPEYDKKKTIAKTVGVEGGTLSLVDSNKVEYTLDIPQGAVSADTEIHMTAVTSVKDWPLDGNQIGAVHLEPEGLVLNDVAILTIGIPMDVNPDLALAGFAFQGDGQEFHLQLSEQEKSLTNNLPLRNIHLASPVFQQSKHIIRLPVGELNVRGVGQASPTNVSKLLKDHAPTGAGDALEQEWAAEDIVEEELTPLDNSIKGVEDPARAKAFDLIKGFYNAENCTQLDSQIALFQIWMNSRAYVGLRDDERSRDTRQVWDELADKAKEILEKASTACEKSSGSGGSAPTVSPCAKALLEKITTPLQTGSGFWDVLKDKMANKLSDSELQSIKDNLEKCMPKAYLMSGSHFGLAGTACDITKPFTLKGLVTMDFTPANASSGTFTYEKGPFNASGGGTYTIGGGSMTFVVSSGCVDPNGKECTSGTEILSMTPIDPATCSSP